MQINLQTDDRVLILGSTGDGKTTAAMALLAQVGRKSGGDPVVILNPGAEERLYTLFGEPTPAINPKFPLVQHVVPQLTRKKRDYGPFFWPQLSRGNCFTYIDELFLLADSKDYSLGLQYMYQAGRRRNCGLIAVSQRPVHIPTFVFDMSDHILVGDIRRTGLQAIESATQQDWAAAVEARQKYEFLHWSRHTKEPPRGVMFGGPSA